MDREASEVSRILFTKKRIARAVKRAAKRLDEKIGGYPVFVCVLKGAAFFYSDLVKAMKSPVQVDFICASSYGAGKESCGKVEIVCDLAADVKERDVVLVDDIMDTGNTLKALKELMLERGAKSVLIVTLLNKPSRRIAEIKPDFCCFEVGNEFIVGYGLDYDKKYRELPYIGVLNPDI